MSEPAADPRSTPPPPDPLAVLLAKLAPAPHGFDRDALMFAAGRESKWWVIRCWQAAATAALLAAGVVAGL